MKKLISLLVAVVLVMGMATVAFAATDAGTHDIAAIADLPASITLGAGETATYMISDWTCYGSNLEVVGVNGKVMVNSWTTANTADSADNKATVVLEGMRYCQVDITNEGTAEATYTLAVVVPLGTQANPEIVTLTDGAAELEIEYDLMVSTEYNLQYTATEAGTFIVSNIAAVDPADATNTIEGFNVQLSTDGFMTVEDSLNPDWTPGTTAAIAVEAGDVLGIMVTVNDYEGCPAVVLTADMAFEPKQGTEENPIPVNAIGDYDVDGDEVWYAVNSMLAGNIIVVTGDDAVLMMGDDVINAEDGIATAVLNGNGATIAVCVKDAEDMIIVAGPVEINAAGDYTATVGAGAEVEYAVNSMLAGAVLTVEGEDAYILIGTTKYEAVDGVATAVLDGEGATIAVKVGNAGNESAEYALNIAYAPTAITAGGDYKVTVGPKAEVEYAVNSKLDGATVTVKGKDAYLIVNGEKVEGKDGVVTAELEAKGATISLIVGNAGTESVEYAMNIAVAGNPQTGDPIVVAAAVALGISAIGGTALISKKKEF